MSVELSIIIPVHNAENYIGECLYSLLQQEYRDFEIVIVDDNSTDESIGRINDVMRSSDISYHIYSTLENQKQGVSAARNIGIERAKGKRVSFIDADDYVDYGLYSRLMSGIEDFDFVYCLNDRIEHNAPFKANGYVTAPEECKLSPCEYITSRGKIWGVGGY